VVRKEVMEVQSLHAWLKFVPRDRFKAGKEVRPVQPIQHSWKLRSVSASVVNVTTGKEVRLVHLSHASKKILPLALDKSKAGKEAIEVQSCQVCAK
jgi:mRNA-degrading endonuclease HigB of HigAB toxin-antitoxin module